MVDFYQYIADAPFLILDGLRRHFLAAMLFAVLQFGDIVSTHVGLHSDLSEANPVASGLFSAAGEGSTYAFKLALVTAFLVLVCLLEVRYPRIWRAVRVTNVVMLLVVLTNTVQLFL